MEDGFGSADASQSQNDKGFLAIKRSHERFHFQHSQGLHVLND